MFLNVGFVGLDIFFVCRLIGLGLRFTVHPLVGFTSSLPGEAHHERGVRELEEEGGDGRDEKEAASRRQWR